MTAPLTTTDIDAALRAPSDEKSETRKRIDETKEKFMRGEGVLPKVVGGAAAVPALLSNLKSKEVKTTQIPL